MPEQRRLLLRLLYTINNSNYILARSPTPVPVTPISDEAPEDQPYAAVSFKKCLQAICRSSPEYMQDSSKDYSVYVLDPLETHAAPAPIDISNLAGGGLTDATAEQSRGVAVGMGLMSLALAVDEKDSTTVVGTLGKTGTGQDALEVILALRETPMEQRRSHTSRSWNNLQIKGRAQASSHTRAQPESTDSQKITIQPSSNSRSLISFPNEMPSAETLATIASIQTRAKAKTKPKKPPRVSSTPVTESDKLLSANTYIGPIKKKGRPKGQTNANAAVKLEEPAAVDSHRPPIPLQAPVPNVCTGIFATTTQPTPNLTPSSSQTAEPSAPPAANGLDFAALAALFSSSQNDTTRNAFLLNALSLIDSSSQEGAQAPVNPALVDALRQLLGSAYTNAQPEGAHVPSALPAPPPPAIPNPAPVNDDDVILLDKENVNPKAFKSRSERGPELSKLGGGDAQVNTWSTEPPPQNRGLGSRSIENSPPKSAHTAAPIPGPSMNMKKRTLDDCMEERDSKRNKNYRTKGKEKERSEKKELPRFLSLQQNYENGFKHYPRLVPTTSSRPEPGTISYYRKPIETWTSPARPQRENVDPHSQMSDPLGGSSLNRPIIIPDSPQARRVTASSPIRPTSEPKKPYIVPAWARTNTALQPRLSEEAQRVIDAAAEKKKEERRANRRKTNAAAQDRHRQREKMVNAENPEASHSEPTEPSQLHESMQPPPLPVMPNSDLPPIIASSDTDLILFAPTNQRAQSPPPTRTSILLPPVTPKRPSKFAFSSPDATDFDEDSLFTPLSVARRSTGTGGSPLFSPGMCGSPLARKKLKVISPAAYRVAARQPGSDSSIVTVKVSETSEPILRQSKSPTLDFDDTQEDLDCPPSSLPIASSDNEFEDTTTRKTNVDDIISDNDLEDEEDPPPRKQHWVGLPPSSPPPPTSPCLMPIDDDGELQAGDIDEELPIASETDEPEEVGEDTVLDATDSDWAPSPNDDDEFTVTLPIISPEDAPPEQEEVMDEMAFLQQFTTFGSSDGLSDVQGDVQGGQDISEEEFKSLFTDNLDLNGFLESFKPLIQEGSLPPPEGIDPISDFDFGAFEGNVDGELLPQSMDHVKMAADLQAMLSGCVV